MIEPGVSVVICSYNGGELLPKTIECLAKQEFESEINWEIIFVDNASTDGSLEIVKTEWEKYNCTGNLRLFQQPKPGKKYAQDLGFESAKLDILLVVDDDNWLYPDYIEKGYKIMKTNPKIGALGGLNLLECDGEIPEWFESVQNSYAVGPQNHYSGDISDAGKGRLFGAGMFINRLGLEYIKKNGFESLLTCRKGDKLTSGGDDELCYALRLAGFQIWYDNTLILKHFMTSNRLSWSYYLRFFKDNGRAFVLLSIYEELLEKTDVKNQKKSYYFKVLQIFYHLTKKIKSLILYLTLPKVGRLYNSKMAWYLSRLKYLLMNKKEYKESQKKVQCFIENLKINRDK